MTANNALGCGPMNPRVMVGKIYKENYYTLLHAKYKNAGPCGFGEDFFFHYKSTAAIRCHGNQRPDLTWVLT